MFVDPHISWILAQSLPDIPEPFVNKVFRIRFEDRLGLNFDHLNQTQYYSDWNIRWHFAVSGNENRDENFFVPLYFLYR